MRARLLVVAIAGLCFGGAALADPAKAPVAKAAQELERPAQVVVASADRPSAADAAQQAAVTPVKRERKARVTTCRCGDQVASDN